jgi:branched-chain amino acid transport system ATP-binding protein
MNVPLLQIAGLHKAFGGLQVTRDVSLSLRAGERVGLIGPNGAGKSTLINLITGVLAPSSGSVHLEGVDITHESQARRVRRGLVRTFQVTQLAPTLTVRSQVELAIHEREGSVRNMWRPVERYPAHGQEARAILAELHMLEWADERPVDLAYGQQRLVEIAIAMALRPRVLLLDEPMAGVPGGEREIVLKALGTLPPTLGMLMIEHDMDLIFSFAHRILVLAEGAVLAEGPPEAIRRHPAVLQAYLGTEAVQ